MIKFILKVLGVIAISFFAVLTWHLGTFLDPLEKNNIALSCLVNAQKITGSRGQVILQSHSSKILRNKKSWVQVLNKSDGSKSEIYCNSRNGKLRFLYVNGNEVSIKK